VKTLWTGLSQNDSIERDNVGFELFTKHLAKEQQSSFRLPCFMTTANGRTVNNLVGIQPVLLHELEDFTQIIHASNAFTGRHERSK
jgi:hypothetical protein